MVCALASAGRLQSDEREQLYDSKVVDLAPHDLIPKINKINLKLGKFCLLITGTGRLLQKNRQ